MSLVSYLIALWKSFMIQIRFAFINHNFVIQDWAMKRVNKTAMLPNTGKTLLITGGTRGLGIEVIKMLLECDFQIIIGCRNLEAAKKLLEEARIDGIFTGEIIAYQLDTSSLNSVRMFARNVKENHKKIHVLLNNAGIMHVPYIETEDGFESIFATNYLGHFLLTNLLLPEIIAASGENCNCRIVNVTSCAHFNGKINFENINHKGIFTYPKAYTQSKLAQVLFTNYLDKLLKEAHCNIDVLCVHPGICDTEIFQGTLMQRIGVTKILKSIKQGAIPIVHCCISPYLDGRGGSYITNCRIKPASKEAQNEELQTTFFKFTIDLLKQDDMFQIK